jgi:hypothetical protein
MGVRKIPRLRFDALAGYCRDPRSAISGEEVGWFEYGDASALGLLLMDRQDRDYRDEWPGVAASLVQDRPVHQREWIARR